MIVAHVLNRNEHIALTGAVIMGRPDFGNYMFGKTFTKTFPPYVYSVRANSALVHRVIRVELDWWAVGGDGDRLERRVSPRLSARCACGIFVILKATRARTCRVPDPGALLCKACHAAGRNFTRSGQKRNRDGDTGITRQEARVRLGCVVTGYGGEATGWSTRTATGGLS